MVEVVGGVGSRWSVGVTEAEEQRDESRRGGGGEWLLARQRWNPGSGGG